MPPVIVLSLLKKGTIAGGETILSTYIAIDLKSYYASAECVARNLDPLTTNLVVADASRTEKTICLAVSPSLKAYGIPGRARLFEVIQKVKEVNAERLNNAIRNHTAVYTEGRPSLGLPSWDADALAQIPSLEVSYLVAPPRMLYYEKLSRQIYGIYLKYIAPEDIIVYSIDEVFIDATAYLSHYHMTAHDLAMTMIRDVLNTTGITATAGIGTNLYLAKLAMDITAKHAAPDKDGVRIAALDEESFRYLLWDHKPLTDFWQTGTGTAAKLATLGIHTMGELARFSLYHQDYLYEKFGVDAEILIDHAWGMEPCTMKDIKAYRPSTTSISEGQVLSCPYDYTKARIIVQEMADNLANQLLGKRLATDGLVLDVGYDRENCDKSSYHGPVHIDRYGRKVPKGAHGTVKLDNPTNLSSQIIASAVNLFDRITDKTLTVRRITLAAIRVETDLGIMQTDLFTDTKKLEKEKQLQQTMLEIKQKFGKNAVLRGTNYLEGATMRKRNDQIGGHKAT
jgi:DNA polymerase V